MLLCLPFYSSLLISCNNKINSNGERNNSAIADTLYSWEYRYLESFLAERVGLPRTIFVPQMMDAMNKDSGLKDFLKLDTAVRLKILRLKRLPSIDLEFDPIILYYDGTKRLPDGARGRSNQLKINPCGIYAPIPTEYLLAFDKTTSLTAPLCPDAVRDVLGKMKNLDSISLTIMSTKPYIINLSGLDMRHIKHLHLHAINCERIIFPTQNAIETLVLYESNFSKFDSSFQKLKMLNYLFTYRIPLKELNLNGLKKLHSAWVVQDKIELKKSNVMLDSTCKIKIISCCDRPSPGKYYLRKEDYAKDERIRDLINKASCN